MDNFVTDEQYKILTELYRCVSKSDFETLCIFRGKIINCDCGYVCDFLEQILSIVEVKDVPVSAKNASASELSDR